MTTSDNSHLAQTAVHLLSNYYQARVQIAQFRQQLVSSFNETELRDLCFDLQINLDSLPGSGTSAKAREIIEFCLRQGRLEELIAYCQQARPNNFEPITLPRQEFDRDESAKAQSLHARLTENIQADPYAVQTLARLAEQPESAARQTALTSLLTELMSDKKELQDLLRQALGETAVGDQIHQKITLSDQAQAGGINMIGKIEGNVPKETFNKEKKKKRWWQRF